MLRKSTFACIVALLVVTVAHAQSDYKFGLGIRLSNADPKLNNSLSVKYMINEGHAIEGLLTFGGPVAIGALYQVHRPLNVEGLKWFFGPGGYVAVEDGDAWVGATGVVGLDYKFVNVPINLSLDWKPELNLVGPDGIYFEAAAVGLSVRFTFR